MKAIFGSITVETPATPQRATVAAADRIICLSCQRTATNGIQCQGKCVPNRG